MIGCYIGFFPNPLLRLIDIDAKISAQLCLWLNMTHLVTDACVRCKYTDCVAVCPVNCFYIDEDGMLVINPDECIDCAVCVAECPANAIVADVDIMDIKVEGSPNYYSHWLEVNTVMSTVLKEEGKNICEAKKLSVEERAVADSFLGETGKFERYINFEKYREKYQEILAKRHGVK